MAAAPENHENPYKAPTQSNDGPAAYANLQPLGRWLTYGGGTVAFLAGCLVPVGIYRVMEFNLAGIALVMGAVASIVCVIGIAILILDALQKISSFRERARASIESGYEEAGHDQHKHDASDQDLAQRS